MSVDFWGISCVMLVLAVIMAIAAMVLKYTGNHKEQYTGYADARVVDIVMEPRNGTYSLSQFYNRQAAVFEFYADGKLVKVKDTEDVYPTPYHMNQRVRILYNPENPQQFCVAGQNPYHLAAKIVRITAICFAALSCICFILHAGRVQL